VNEQLLVTSERSERVKQ